MKGQWSSAAVGGPVLGQAEHARRRRRLHCPARGAESASTAASARAGPRRHCSARACSAWREARVHRLSIGSLAAWSRRSQYMPVARGEWAMSCNKGSQHRFQRRGRHRGRGIDRLQKPGADVFDGAQRRRAPTMRLRRGPACGPSRGAARLGCGRWPRHRPGYRPRRPAPAASRARSPASALPGRRDRAAVPSARHAPSMKSRRCEGSGKWAQASIRACAARAQSG